MGARHALFPRFTGIGRATPPVECCWLPVPRRCAGVHGLNAIRCGPAAEPARDVTINGRVGRDFSARIPSRLPAVAVRTLTERTWVRVPPWTRGRQRAHWHRSFAPRDGSCPLSLKLHSSPRRTTLRASRGSDLIARLRSLPGFPAASHSPLIPRNRDRFSPLRLRHRPALSVVHVVHARRTPCSTLARSSNCRSMTDCVRATSPNQRVLHMTRLCDGFMPRAPLFSASPATVANRLTSRSL